jgi:anti-sigma B factor antagonist
MMQVTTPRVLIETVHGITVASFTDEAIVSEEVILEVGEQLVDLLDGARPERLVLNFREVRSMSSTMLAILLKVARKVGQFGGRLKLCCLAADLQEIFRITRFDRLFEIYDEESLALDSF